MTEMLQPVFAILLVLGLLGGLLYFLRRRGMASFSGGVMPFGRQSAADRQVRVLERIPLGTQHALHLVRGGGRTILIGTAPGGCQLLDTAVMEEPGSGIVR